MIYTILFLFQLILSCNRLGSSMVYNMDYQGSSETHFSFDPYMANKDGCKCKDEAVFDRLGLLRFYALCGSFIGNSKRFTHSEKLILYFYNCLDKGGVLPNNVEEVWQEGKQATFMKVPEKYKQSSLSMVLALVDMVFQANPKYDKLSKVLDDFDQRFNERAKVRSPTYSDELAYVKKLFMEYFDELNDRISAEAFYPECWRSSVPSPYVEQFANIMPSVDSGKWDSTMPSAWPIAWYSGSNAVRKGFQDFFLNLKKIK